MTPEIAPSLGYGHLTTAIEFRGLFDSRFDQVQLVGIESFGGGISDFDRLAPDVRSSWLDLVEATNGTPEGIAMADHFLVIAKR